MGDSPSVGYLLHATRDDPWQAGWGGRFVRVWDDRKTTFARLTTERDRVEAFGVVEFSFPVPDGMAPTQAARMMLDDHIPARGFRDGRTIRRDFADRMQRTRPD